MAKRQKKIKARLVDALARPSGGLSEVFLQRSLGALERISRRLSEQELASALAAPTDIGTLARALAGAAEDAATREADPFADAIARNAQHRQQLVELGGGLLAAPEVGAHLRISRQAVDKRRLKKRLLAVRIAGDWKYPAFQFDERMPAEALAAVIKTLDDSSGWSALDFLLAPDTVLENRTPAKALTLGPAWAAAVLRLARAERAEGFS